MPNNQRLAQLMQLLEIIQAGKAHDQQNSLGYAGIEQQGNFHQGELDHQRALDALGIATLQQQAQQHASQLGEEHSYHQGELTHQQAMIDASKEAESNRMNTAIAEHIFSNPSIPMDKALSVIAPLDPRFAKMGEAWHQGGVSSAIEKQTPTVQGMYDIYNKGHNYPQLQSGLAALKSVTPSEVYSGLPWGDFNQGMYQAPTTDSTPSTQVGTGFGAMLGHVLRNTPGMVATGLQNTDTSMTDMGSNFWANLFGLTAPKPDNKPVRPWGPFSN